MKLNTCLVVCLAFPGVLAGCAASAIRAEGEYLQVGPPDALLGEFALPDMDHCEYLLTYFRPSRCVAKSANLPYTGLVRNDFWAVTLPVSARTLSACNDWQNRVRKTDGWKIVEPCKPAKPQAPAPAQSGAATQR